MATEVDNIIQGAAEIYLAPKGTAYPAMAEGTTAGTSAGNIGAVGAYASVGHTSEGLEISFEPDYLDAEVDQLLDSAVLFKTSQRVTIATSFSEATLDNLNFVLGQSVTVPAAITTAGSTRALPITGGALGAAPVEKAFFAVGPSVRKGLGSNKFSERHYYNPRVISVEAVSTAVKRNEVSMFPVTFRCLPDSTATGAEYGKIVDRVYGT